MRRRTEEGSSRPTGAVWRWAIVAGLLALGVAAVYAPVGGFPFVYDDEGYIVANPIVANGVTAAALREAFTGARFANWHPLTWLSHMVDVELFGLDAGWHHLVNVALHAACAAALLRFLVAATGAFWPSALAAAVFALHPLRVESVAWVTERKDALSTIFVLLAAAAWVRRPPRAGSLAGPAVTALFVLGLLAKPMAVTLPLLLLLLDWWPLGRFPGAATAQAGLAAAGRLAREKALLLLLAAGGAVAAVLAQRSEGAVRTLQDIPLAARLANAPVAAVTYLGKTLWPARLAVFYPHPGRALSAWEVGACAAALLALSALALLAARSRPWISAGWLWYLVTLAPVIGLVQVGDQALADRYTYLPSVGLSIALAGEGAAVARRSRRAGRLLAAAAVAACTALAVAARAQTAYWRDDLALYGHALEVTAGNWKMHNNRGVARERRGDLDGAAADYRETIGLRPRDPEAYVNLARVLERRGRDPEAIMVLESAIRTTGDATGPRRALAGLLARRGRFGEAEAQFRELERLGADPVGALVDAATVRAAAGDLPGAEALLLEALGRRPDSPQARANLGTVLARRGRFPEADAQYREALRLAPGDAPVRLNHALVLEAAGHPAEALAEYRAAARLDPHLEQALLGAQRLERAGR